MQILDDELVLEVREREIREQCPDLKPKPPGWSRGRRGSCRPYV